jgi:hypothetical protein
VQIEDAIENASLSNEHPLGQASDNNQPVDIRIAFEKLLEWFSNKPQNKRLRVCSAQMARNRLTGNQVTKVFYQRNANKLLPGAPALAFDSH